MRGHICFQTQNQKHLDFRSVAIRMLACFFLQEQKNTQPLLSKLGVIRKSELAVSDECLRGLGPSLQLSLQYFPGWQFLPRKPFRSVRLPLIRKGIQRFWRRT